MHLVVFVSFKRLIHSVLVGFSQHAVPVPLIFLLQLVILDISDIFNPTPPHRSL